MCGIIGAFHHGDNKEPVNLKALEIFEDQKSRGTEGFGLVKISDDLTYKLERSTEGFKFMYDIHQDPVRMMLIHHRIPTSTPNKSRQTHPISVDNGSLKHKYLVVHNGVISNAVDLIEEHEKLGFVYTTKQEDGKFNDSESLAIEVCRFIEGQVKKVGTKGSAAFIALQINKKTDKVVKIYFSRNTNPLNMAKTRGKMILSSEGPGTEVAPGFLYECKFDKDMKLSKHPMILPAAFYATIPAKTTSVNYYHKDSKFANAYDDDYNERWNNGIYSNNKDLPPVEEEETVDEEISNTVSKAEEEIGEQLEEFYGDIYDADRCLQATDDSIDWYLESIKTSMVQALKEAKEYYTEKQLTTDEQAQETKDDDTDKWLTKQVDTAISLRDTTISLLERQELMDEAASQGLDITDPSSQNIDLIMQIRWKEVSDKIVNKGFANPNYNPQPEKVGNLLLDSCGKNIFHQKEIGFKTK